MKALACKTISSAHTRSVTKKEIGIFYDTTMTAAAGKRSIQRVAAQAHQLHFTRTTVMLTLSNLAEIWCEAAYSKTIIPKEILAHLDQYFLNSVSLLSLKFW